MGMYLELQKHTNFCSSKFPLEEPKCARFTNFCSRQFLGGYGIKFEAPGLHIHLPLNPAGWQVHTEHNFGAEMNIQCWGPQPSLRLRAAAHSRR